ATGSAIALMQLAPILMSLDQYGTSPHRRRSSERRPSRSSRTAGSVSVGAPLYVGAAFGTGLTVSNSTRISPSGVFCATRPHMPALLHIPVIDVAIAGILYVREQTSNGNTPILTWNRGCAVGSTLCAGRPRCRSSRAAV